MLSFVPKMVGIVALLRLLPLVGASGISESVVEGPSAGVLLGGLAIASMLIGNLLALRQQSLFRLFAYSGVAHAGYMLMGLAVGPSAGLADGVSAALFYLTVYGLTTIGVFALFAGVSTSDAPVRAVSDLSGLSRVHPAVALSLTVCLFSLAGLPPTSGFIGKWNLFAASWSEGTTLGRVLAISLALNAAIGAWYYLRLIAVMFLETAPAGEPRKVSLAPAVAGAVCAIATVLLFAAPQAVWDAAARFTP
jgi:NADH-quinone oxidoreductase subunit N